MPKLSATPNKVWEKGSGVGALFLMKRLAVGESLLLKDRKNVHASATIGRYRQTCEPNSQWTSKTTADGVVLIRLANLSPEALAAKKAAVFAVMQARREALAARGGPLKPKPPSQYAAAVADMGLDEPLFDNEDDDEGLFD